MKVNHSDSFIFQLRNSSSCVYELSTWNVLPQVELIDCSYWSREEGREKEMEETQREFHHEEEEEHADVNIWKYILGFSEMAVVKCAIDLGIVDAIERHGSPITLSDLSSTLGCASSPLYRIMRFLMHRGIFKEKLTTQRQGGRPPNFDYFLIILYISLSNILSFFTNWVYK